MTPTSATVHTGTWAHSPQWRSDPEDIADDDGAYVDPEDLAELPEVGAEDVPER